MSSRGQLEDITGARDSSLNFFKESRNKFFQDSKGRQPTCNISNMEHMG